jgi:hypothetical protein
MLGLLERSIASIERRLVLLAPAGSIAAPFGNVTSDGARHASLLSDMQRLRGGIYLEDGAITHDHLTADGRHRTPEDDASWHLLMVDGTKRITSCVWYRQHAHNASIDQLRVRECPLRRDDTWRHVVTRAVEAQMAQARMESLRYVEVGGWAVSKQARGAVEGLVLALGAYSLGRMFGGALGLTTATVRHCSSRILRRLGGAHLEIDGTIVPPYYDPRYDCTMELLRFDSRRPDSRYARLVEALGTKLEEVEVLVGAPAVSQRRRAGALVGTEVAA